MCPNNRPWSVGIDLLVAPPQCCSIAYGSPIQTERSRLASALTVDIDLYYTTRAEGLPARRGQEAGTDVTTKLEKFAIAQPICLNTST